jgi:transcriptional regulator GlxA family with amidase domain
MASLACLSISQFERRFIQQTGITPKFYTRINRFYQAYQIKEKNPKNDWLSIALETGYHDYQHLVKDFKQFSDTTPHSLLKAQASSPERILGIV